MRKERILTRGGFVEAPTNTHTGAMPVEITEATGLTEFKLTASTDGSYITDIQLTFIDNGLAEDFRAHGASFVVCGSYGENGADLPAAVGSVISDSWTFADVDQYNDFLNQVKGDLNLEMFLPLPYYN